MNFKKSHVAVLAALLMALAGANATAHVADPYGISANQALPDRVITVDAETKYINVQQGEIIKFVFQEKSFIWKFDTFNRVPFDFGEIAPIHFANPKAKIYLEPNPLYIG